MDVVIASVSNIDLTGVFVFPSVSHVVASVILWEAEIGVSSSATDVVATIWVTGSEFIAFDGGVATDSVSMDVLIASFKYCSDS